MHDRNVVIKMQDRKMRDRKMRDWKKVGLENAGPVNRVTRKRFVTPLKKCCRFL